MILSSTITPKAPSVVVTEATAKIPAISQSFINNFVFSRLFIESGSQTLPKKTAYNTMIIKTANKEKKTAALSRKNSFKLRFTKTFIALTPFLLYQ